MHVIEYAGDTIVDMTMAERMTICNMSIECGAKAGMIAPDHTTNLQQISIHAKK